MASVYIQANHDETGNWDDLVDKRSDPQLFKQSILRIRENSLKMEDRCRSLIRSVSRLNWAFFDAGQLDQIFELLREVFTAHPFTVKIGIEGVILSFFKHNLTGDKDIVLEPLSEFLYFAVKVSPIAKVYVLDSLSRNIPFPNRPKSFLMNFYNLSFILANKLPAMREELCEIIIKGLIKLDVELPNEKRSYIMKILMDLRENNIPVEEALKFYMIDEKISGWLPLADKYDEILSFSFEKFQKLSKLCRKAKISFYRCLQSGFSKVLACRGLVAVHFIWFYFASTEKKFRYQLLNELWEKFNNPVEHVYVRHTCLTYLSGIISRGLFIKSEEFAWVLDKLAEWIQAYLLNDNGSNYTPECTKDMTCFSRNHLFYVACQSLFYCIIFYSKRIQKNSDDGRVWITYLNQLNLERIFYSNYNPLFHCYTKLVDQMATLGVNYEIFYIYPLLHRNQKVSKRIKSKEASKENDEYVNMIDLNNPCNFPFDSYVMPSTKDLINPIYRTWKKE